MKIRQNDEIRRKSVTINLFALSAVIFEAVVKYKNINPDILIYIHQSRSLAKYDIIVDSLPPNESIAKEDILCEEPLMLAVAEQSKLAEKDSISLKEVSSEAWVCLDTSQQLRQISDMFCKEAGFYPNVVFEGVGYGALREICQLGQGCTIWPKYSWGKLASGIKLLNITQPECKRTVIINKSAWVEPTSATNDFYNYLKKFCSTEEIEKRNRGSWIVAL